MVIDRISESMASLVKPDMYGAIDTADNTSNVLYVIQLISEAHPLQNNTTIDGQVISASELFSRNNIFAPYKKTPIGIGNNNHYNRSP